jgi:uncharacterized protein YyaL (SSP411 family)
MRARATIVGLTVLALAAGLLSGLVLGAEATVHPRIPAPPRLTAAAARRALAAFNKAFYSGSTRQGFYVDSTTTGLADFWKEAEMIETVEDYYRLTGDPAYERLTLALCRGVIGRYGSNWLHLYWPADHKLIGQRANDDVMWMVIAFARASALSGDPTYLHIARQNFDPAYARAWSSALGGGLWWRTATDRPGKNTTTNAPAVIAAVNLYKATHDGLYLTRAESLYGWVRSHLFDPRTGRVFDGLVLHGKNVSVDRTQYTYNQGSFIGAADALYAVTGDRVYYTDALSALAYTRADLTRNGILQNDSSKPDQDSGGFKGIFARWAIAFTRQNHITSYDSWFRLNADMAWAQRNNAGIVGWRWTAKTGVDTPYSWDNSSAVAMMEALLPTHGR